MEKHRQLLSGKPMRETWSNFPRFTHISCVADFEEKFHVDNGILFGWAESRSLSFCSAIQGTWESFVMLPFHCAPSREPHFVQGHMCMYTRKQKLICNVSALSHITGWIVKNIYTSLFLYIHFSCSIIWS